MKLINHMNAELSKTVLKDCHKSPTCIFYIFCDVASPYSIFQSVALWYSTSIILVNLFMQNHLIVPLHDLA